MKKTSNAFVFVGFFLVIAAVCFHFMGIPTWVAAIGIILMLLGAFACGIIIVPTKPKPIQYVKPAKTKILCRIGRSKG